MAIQLGLPLGGRERRPKPLGLGLPFLKRLLHRWRLQAAQRLKGLAGALRWGRGRLSDLPPARAPRLGIRDFALSATMGLRERTRRWQSHRDGAGLHTLDAVLWTLTLALAVIVGLAVARL